MPEPTSPLSSVIISTMSGAELPPVDGTTLAPPDPNSSSGQIMSRETPVPDESRRQLVSEWTGRVTAAREFWEKRAFKDMRKWMRLARGDQWTTADDLLADDPGSRYVANIILRHIHSRTASIYGKNPKVVARRKQRLMSSVWDGSIQTLMLAQKLAVPDPTTPGSSGDPTAQAIVADAMKTMQYDRQMDRVASTLELLYQHEIEEQPVSFKVQMKANIRRTLTTGVGWVKLGFKRVMAPRPEDEAAMNDISDRLANIQRLSTDIADGEVLTDSAEAEELKLSLAALAKNAEQIVVREGLTISYPDSTAIIPDPATKQLRGFVGAAWAAEQFLLTPAQVKKIYKKDLGHNAMLYSEDPTSQVFRASDAVPDPNRVGGIPDDARYCVWEIYDKDSGLVYVVADGYPDFLAEPGPPDVWLERFFPWFAFVTNEVYDERTVFPPSDVSLIKDMQLELNRARQGLREHRRAARPKTFVRKSVLEEEDKQNIETAKANAIIELAGLPDGMAIKDALQPFQGPGIDPNLYDTSPAYQDILRVVGQQEADFGGTSGATATETNIAEGARISSVASVIDDLDEFLTELARAAGQILLSEMQPETVKKIVGPGAVWPEFSRDEIARDIYLDIEAASTGRPNKAQEIQNAQMVFPLLMQIPGMSAEWMAKELLRRLDDRLDLTDAFEAGAPSIQALNAERGGMSGLGAGVGRDPNAQGVHGAANAPSTQPAQVNAAPRPPGPTPVGQNPEMGVNSGAGVPSV